VGCHIILVLKRGIFNTLSLTRQLFGALTQLCGELGAHRLLVLLSLILIYGFACSACFAGLAEGRGRSSRLIGSIGILRRLFRHTSTP
jgi:hypothetical protein